MLVCSNHDRSYFRMARASLPHVTMCQTFQLNNQKGLATFLASTAPVTGSLNSFQLIGYMAFPASDVAMMTPRWLLAVDR